MVCWLQRMQKIGGALRLRSGGEDRPLFRP
jgi:hypothetical protein